MKRFSISLVFSMAAAFALVACAQENVDGLDMAEETGASESEKLGEAESALTTPTGFTCAAGYSLLIENNVLTCKKVTTQVMTSPTPVGYIKKYPQCSSGQTKPLLVNPGLDFCAYYPPSCLPAMCPPSQVCGQTTYVVDGYDSTGYDSCDTPYYNYSVTTTDYKQPILQ